MIPVDQSHLFQIQAPHGAAGWIDVPIHRRDTVSVTQKITGCNDWDALRRARVELVVDDAVLATSGEPVVTEEADGWRLVFWFPSISAPPQHYGVRYIYPSVDGTWRRAEMTPAC